MSWRDESFLQMIGWGKMGQESDELFFGGEMGKFVMWLWARNSLQMKVGFGAMPLPATAIPSIRTRVRVGSATDEN